jgi:hypothetical protein
MQICSKCITPASWPGITFDTDGVCSLCRAFERRFGAVLKDRGWWERASERLDRILEWAKRKKGGAYDVLVPVSGGKDSLNVLYELCVEKRMSVLAYTYDNGLMSEQAIGNLETATRALGVSHVMVRHAFQIDLVRHFLKKTGNICGACFVPMVFTAYEVARRFEIPLIVFGVSRRLDPLLPRGKNPWHFWNVVEDGFDVRKLRGAWSSMPVFQWLKDSLAGRVKVISLPDYIEWDEDPIRVKLESALGVTFGEEHSDCIGSEYADYLAFSRYGFSIRAIKLAALVRNGKMDRGEALKKAKEIEPKGVPEGFERLAERLSVSVEDLISATSIDESSYYRGVMNYLSDLYRKHFLGR